MFDLGKIFSIKNEKTKEKKHKVVTILGIKFKIRIHFKKNFFDRQINTNTILLIELNHNSHRETMPGYAKYLLDLGYNVEVLVSESIGGSFCRFPEKIKIYRFPESYILEIMQDSRLSCYKRLIFNSKVIYKPNNWIDIHEFIPNLKSGQKKNLYVQHHIDRLLEVPDDRQCILANPSKCLEQELLIVNPHYFGNIKNHLLNKKVKFLVVGALEKRRKNVCLLFDALNKLNDMKVDNYEVIVIGRCQDVLDDLDNSIKKHLILRGRLNFSDMYKEIENADYFLTLLDPKNKEHDRYIKDGTSGCFQLVYGFLKPCLIHKKFADVYSFNDDNSFVYAENAELADAMLSAINTDRYQYKKLQNNILKIQKNIYETSLENLKQILDGE